MLRVAIELLYPPEANRGKKTDQLILQQVRPVAILMQTRSLNEMRSNEAYMAYLSELEAVPGCQPQSRPVPGLPLEQIQRDARLWIFNSLGI